MNGDAPASGLGVHPLSPAGLRIAEEIAQRGPMTFHRFMDLALYAPDVGYYMRRLGGIGPEGDYLTSPEIHPAFGTLLCAQFDEMWRNLGRPSTFWLIEGGPGTGHFAGDVLASADAAFPRFARALRVGLMERSDALRTRQEERLACWDERVQWIDPLSPALETVGCGCVFANELLDAFPVHRVIMQEGGLLELYVAGAGPFHAVEGHLSSHILGDQIRDGGGRLEVGQVGEVNPGTAPWVAVAAGLLDRGYLLLLDYGETAGSLYGARHPRGTLRCYWHHTMNEEPFLRIGLQDITAHVDLSAVARAALRVGLGLLGATTQQRLLDRLGIGELVERVEECVARRSEQRAHRAALHLLTDKDGLGRITASIFGKGVPDMAPMGFQGAAPIDPVETPNLWSLRLDALGAIQTAERSAAQSRPED